MPLVFRTQPLVYLRVLMVCFSQLALLMTMWVHATSEGPRIQASKPRVRWQRTLDNNTKLIQWEAGNLLLVSRNGRRSRWAVVNGITGSELLTAESGWSGSNARLSGQWLLVATASDDTKKTAIVGWNLTTGKQEWSVACKGICWAGAVVGNHLFISDDNAIRRILIPKGTDVQRTDFAHWKGVQNSGYRWDFDSSYSPGVVISDGNRVYFGALHTLFGLQCDDLTRGWWSYCEAMPQRVDQDGIYGVSWNYRLVALDKTGKALWKPDPHVWGDRLIRYAINRDEPPAVNNRAVIVGGMPPCESREKSRA